jgi:hypothetical protein
MPNVIRSLQTPALCAVMVGVLASCGGDSVTDPAGETEVISRVTLTLTPTTGAAISAYIDDPDGNGPTSPSAQVGTLSIPAGSSFTGAIRFENRLVTPVEDITTEVAAESAEHRVFYTVTGGGVTFTTTDVDGATRPVGLAFTAAAPAGTAAGARTVRVVLCHYDGVIKPATASSCTAETDIDVTFNVTVP